MYVSSCKSVDMRIDIVEYEEGFFSVVKIIEKGLSITNVSVKVRSKTIVKITIEWKVEFVFNFIYEAEGANSKMFWSIGTGVCPFQFVSDGRQV